MKIGLIDVDSHNCFPNLALMKISAYHKKIGDNVEFVDNMFGGRYDKVYMSKVFTFTPDYAYNINCDNIIKAGTGYHDYKTVLSQNIENICPDYSLYGVDYAVGFLTRGCPNKCSWCVVPKKEGKVRANQDVEEFLDGKSKAIFLDNNVLACDFGLEQIEKCIRLGINIDFNQGLDARIIANNPNILDLLGQVKWIRFIRLACDTKAQMPYVAKCVEELCKRGIKPYKIFVYTLIKEYQESLERIRYMKELNITPFAQPYIDFEKVNVKQWQKDMARWCNHKALFNTCDFKEYEPRKGFKCINYESKR